MTDDDTSTKPDDTLIRHRQQFADWADNSKDERDEAERNRDYFDNIQWDSRQVAILRARGQPVITDNKIKGKIEYMQGIEQKTRTDPKALPRTPKHESDAEVATDSIRYVFDKNRFSNIKSAVFQTLMVEGFAAAEVTFDKVKDEVSIQKCRWDRVYRDPYSMEPDCSDARYFGLITWMDYSRARDKYGNKNFLEFAPVRQSSETTDDKPRWIDAKRKRVQVFQHYEWLGDGENRKLYVSVWCWGGYLEKPKECPYVTDENEHDSPLIFASVYVGRDGKRYSPTSGYVPIQDEINQRRSKSLHLLVSQGIVADKGATENPQKTRDELASTDFYIEKVPGADLEIIKNLDLSAGHFQLLQQAEASFAMHGPNADLSGQGKSTSGRQVELNQQGGSIQAGPVIDIIRDWQLRIARSVWYRIKQYWDTEDFIRVTDDEDKVKFIALNQPILLADVATEELGKNDEFKQLPPEEQEGFVRQIAADPRMQQPLLDEKGQIRKKNDISKIDVDLILDEAPDTVTIQAEQFEKITQLAATGVVPIPPDVLIELSQLRSNVKKRVQDKLSGADNPQAAQMAQLQQMMQELEQALKAAQVHKTESEAEKNEAQTAQIQTSTVKTGLEAASGLVGASEPPSPPGSPPAGAVH